MYICNKCGKVYAEPVSSCAICGCAVITQKVIDPIVNSVSVDAAIGENNNAPRISGGTRAKGIIGFVMAVEAVAASAIYAFYALLLVFMMLGYGDVTYELFNQYFGFGYINSLKFVIWVYIFSLIAQFVIGLVAISLCNSAKEAGYVSKMTSAGNVLGILTAVISIVSVILLLFMVLLAS